VTEAAARRPFVLGVTGDIACGKSTVLAMLAERGAMTIDADAVYHALIAPGQPLWRALRERYGAEILAPDGGIDRRALGRIVFADPAALADLDALTHPAVVAAVRERIAVADAAVVAVDAVKLVESGLADACDRVWLVTCAPEQQVARLMARNGLSREEAERRVAAQPPLGPKLARADTIIANGGTLGETQAQVEAAWDSLQLPYLSS
jgi:dephospho-CoA kinase